MNPPDRVVEIVVTKDGCLLYDRERASFTPCPYWSPTECSRPTGCLSSVRALACQN
ncbi:MAG TPA: hypothetical protein VD926_12970 [Acidimicrobiales bacterium]|nr:hypothetical protein [Acidimicrobiales bacterium]